MIEEYDRIVEGALERGENPVDVLAHKTMPQFEPPEVECGECFHPISDHGKNGCEHDRSITVEEVQIDGECGCTEHVIADRLQRYLQRAYEAVNQ